MTGRRWTLSNLLSILRILLAAPILIAMTSEGVPRWLLPALAILAVATDFFDGFLARRLNEESQLGRVLDPVADKILIGLVALTLTLQGRFPAWLLAAIILRDLLILAGGFWLMRMPGSSPPPSNPVGKAAAAIMAATLLAALFGDPDSPLFIGFVVLSTVGIVVSLGMYAAAFRNAIAKP